MNRLITVSLFLMALSGCSNRIESIGTIPSFPSVKIIVKSSLKSFFRDSIKLSNPNFNTYGIELRLSDSDKYYNSLTYIFEKGNGKLVYRNDTLNIGLLPFMNYKCLVKFIPGSEGLTRLIFKATDQLNNSNSSALELLTFKNLLPIADLQVSPVKIIDPLEYLLDASRSYDPDHNFGGGIVQYIYQVDGQIIYTSKDQIKHIFSSPGVFTITIQAEDNDGGFSSVISKEISIN